MDIRPGAPPQRPPPPQRALSGSYALQQGLRRAPVPSRLNNVRSFSQPVNAVDLTAEAARFTDGSNSTAFLINNSATTTSPEALDQSEDDAERPAKRAKTNGHDLRPQDGERGPGADAAHELVPGSPLPPMRKVMAPPSRTTATRRSRDLVDKAARRANGLEPPTMATRLPSPKNVADFSPWSGSHPEDIMNETVVKAGYYDKPPGPNSTECNSAKPTIWPNLSQKNNMGLQTLSYLFSQVMEKRQQMGRCTVASTFKPPPRVTVTDTKREAWLRDLANADVPLRKQSRTIPHGIRGKPLMEHCLAKNIPLPRAVWLAKCVGANELRAFRRKGVSGTTAASGESKWIRDWTVQVESFLEAVIADCGKRSWQSNMDYAVKLATSLYSERLLERDHYLNWIVSSFSQAAVDRLPIWIILAQLYWKDITAFGRRGRQLAEAVLEALNQSSAGTCLVNNTLRDRLKKLVVVLAVTNRGCLILPKVWSKYRHLLTPQTLSSSSSPIQAATQNILKRNFRLMSPLSKTPKNTKCALLELYNVLDDISTVVDYSSLAKACLAKVQDTQRLVSAILDWTASVYRTGQSRIYLGAKIILELYDRGVDIDAAILDYLYNARIGSLAPALVYRVIAELIRAGCFFPGRYLQSLMTSGVLYNRQSSILFTGLITALPQEALPPHLRNTRNTLMRRLGWYKDESAILNQLHADITASTNGSAPGMLLDRVNTLSGSAKLELASRLVFQFTSSAKECRITLQSFCLLRDILECSNDIPKLGHLMQAAAQTDEAILLTTITDTANLYATAFAAIGCLHLILDQLLERYRALRTELMDRNWILALSALMRRCPDKHGVARHLENDLALCDQHNSNPVWSPASDNLIGMQATNLDSDSDIDAVFLSGNTMDEQLMQRVFNRIIQRAAKSVSQDEHAPGKLCGWLNQLRTLDASCFDQLVQNFVQVVLLAPTESANSSEIICALVASGNLDFGKLTALAHASNTTSAASLVIEVLASNSINSDGLHPVELFRFRTLRITYRTESANAIRPLLAQALQSDLLNLNDTALASLILDCSVNNQKDYVPESTTVKQAPTLLVGSERATRLMLQLSGERSSADSDLKAKSIMALANPLSIVPCAAALQYYSETDVMKSTQGREEMQEAILEAITSGCEVWPQLLERSGRETTRAIYFWAREQVLDNLLRFDGQAGSSADLKRCLDILDVAHHVVVDEDSASVLAILIEKLRILENRLTMIDTYSPAEREFGLLMASLQILLHLSILFAVGNGAESEVLKQNRASLLGALCALLVHTKLQTQQAILEYVHDVASAISDNLPVEALSSLAKNASPGIARDVRLGSIIGTSPSPDAWLALVTHIQAQGSQQQRALLKQQQVSAARQVPQSPIAQQKAPVRPAGETKIVPFPLRRWEIMSDAAPTVGDNDTSLSLTLFGARKV